MPQQVAGHLVPAGQHRCGRGTGAEFDLPDHIGAEELLQGTEVAVGAGGDEPFGQRAVLLGFNQEASGAGGGPDAAAGPAGRLAAGVGGPAYDGGDGVERVAEHLVQHEHRPFGGAQLLEHHVERHPDAVVEGDTVGRPDAERRIRRLTAAFGLAAVIDRPVAGYSGGQRRRLEIARALVSEPQVLFLDEPTVGLDPRIRYELLDLIDGLRTGARMTILLTTHYLDEAERLCDRVAVVHQGRVVALDTPRALLAGLGPAVVEVHVDGDVDVALATLRASRLAAGDAFAVGSTILVPLHDCPPGQAVTVITALDLPVVSVGTRTPSLDDVYLRLTGDRLAAAA